MLISDLRRIAASADVIEGVQQIMSGRLTMEMTDSVTGDEYRVKITLEPIK